MSAIGSTRLLILNGMSARPLVLWAPIIRSTRAESIVWSAIRLTRRAAREAYLEPIEPEFRDSHLLCVRFARVVVAEGREAVECVPTGPCLLRQR